MNPFQSLREYERFIYTLQQRYPAVLHTTLTVARRGRGLATVVGELHFAQGYRLVVAEIITWDEGPLLIQHYSYEVWRDSEKLYWYDPSRTRINPNWQARIRTINTSAGHQAPSLACARAAIRCA